MRSVGAATHDSQGIEKPLHLCARAETVGIYPLVDSCEEFEHARAGGLRIRPHPSQEREVELLSTALGQVRARAAPIPYQALEKPPQARGTRRVDKDHSVSPLEAGVFLATLTQKEVAVEDPLITGDHCVEGAQRLILGCLRPPMPPEQRVEVNDGKSRALGDERREGAFARSSRTYDSDASHCFLLPGATSRPRFVHDLRKAIQQRQHRVAIGGG
jgi:hypothetical protein